MSKKTFIARVTESEHILEYVKFNQAKEKYCVYKHDTDQELACFATKDEADAHLKRMQIFKHMDESDARKVMESAVSGVEVTEAKKKDGSVWLVKIIQKGMSHNRTIYTDEALEDIKTLMENADKSGAPIPCMAYDFNGVKNHLDDMSREKNPGGFAKNLVGWFKNAFIKAGDLFAELHVSEHAKWLKDCLLSAFGSGIKKPFGLSIDGRGELEEEQKSDGPAWWVRHIKDLAEVTVVTHPSAGGEFRRPLESIFESVIPDYFNSKEKTMKFWKLILEAIAKTFGAVTEGVDLEKADLDVVKGILGKVSESDPRFNLEVSEEKAEEVYKKILALNEAIANEAHKKQLDELEEKARKAQEALAKASAGKGKPVDVDVDGDGKTTVLHVPESVKALAEKVERIEKREVKMTVDEHLSESKLPAKMKDLIRDQYDGARTIDVKRLKEQIIAMEEAVQDASGDDSQAPVISVVKEQRAKSLEYMQNHFDILMGVPSEDGSVRDMRESCFNGIKDLYEEITGDRGVTGVIDPTYRPDFRRGRIKEAIAISDFSTMLGTSMTKHMVNEYNAGDPIYKKICQIRPLRDYKQQDLISFGEYANLAAVSENAAYAEFATPTEETASYTPSKRGNYIGISREAILTDDLRKFAQTAKYLGRAALRTLNQYVFDLMLSYTSAINDTTIYDGVILYSSTSHANKGTSALSESTFRAGHVSMYKQKDLDSKEELGIMPKYIVVPIDLEATARVIVDSQFKPGGNNNDINTEYNKAEVLVSNFLRGDTNNWYLVADPKMWDTIELGFVQGREMPAILKADSELVGAMFTNDQIRFKVRHEYGGAVVDYRSFYGAIVA